MLLEENELQHQLIHNYIKKTDVLQEQVVVLSEQKNLYKDISENQARNIEDLQKQINKKDKTIKGLTIGGVSVTVGLILFLIFK